MAAKIPGLELPPTESDGAGMEIGKFHVPHKDLHGRCRNIHQFEGFSKIKEGGFGNFFIARDIENNKFVTLKSYNLEKELNDDTFTAVMTEINTLHAMEHRNLVKLLEVISGETLVSIWILFDCHQYSLSDLFKFPSFLISRLVKKIMEEILCGLKYLHSAKYCHGNLNPENILFDSSGVLKISDYTDPNIYHKTTPLDSSEIKDPVLNMMLNYCVLWYKPLEILMGCKKQHPAIDMWAVGCIFAELLLKKPLFAGESIAAVCEDIINLLGFPEDVRLPSCLAGSFYSLSNHLTRQSFPPGRTKNNLKELYIQGFSELLQQNKVQVIDSHGCTKLQKKFIDHGTTCVHLLAGLFVYNLNVRLTAEQCLIHPYFKEEPTAGSNENLAHLLKVVQEMTDQTK